MLLARLVGKTNIHPAEHLELYDRVGSIVIQGTVNYSMSLSILSLGILTAEVYGLSTTTEREKKQNDR